MSEKRDGEPRVLVVDDTPATRYAMVRVLRHAGFNVIEAENGTAALRLAKDSQVVCLDVQLPDISGFEVCARLKADPATSSIPVVHVTASYADDLSMARGLEGGADAYLT